VPSIYLFGDDANNKLALCYNMIEDEWKPNKLADSA